MIEFVCRVCGFQGYTSTLDHCTCLGCGVIFDNPSSFTLPRVLFLKLHKDAVPPQREVEGDVGYSAVALEDYELPPMEVVMIKTGISVELPPHTEMQVRARSGMAKKHGIMVVNGPGTIDTAYRGPCNVLLINTKLETYNVKKGDAVAQFLVTTKLPYTFQEAQLLSDTERGDGGFGHTGR